MPSPSRRQQRAITIRSDHELARLALLTHNGRSQVQVIEEALDRTPLPKRLFLTSRNGGPALANVPKRTCSTMAKHREICQLGNGITEIALFEIVPNRGAILLGLRRPDDFHEWAARRAAKAASTSSFN